MLNTLMRAWRAKEGMAAVEFALIAPVLVVLLIGSIEVCNALEAHQKVTNVASSAADLVAQTSSVSSADMSNVFAAASAILAPFDATGAEIVVSSIVTDGSGTEGTVNWSQSSDGGNTLSGSVPVPDGLMPKAQCGTKGSCSVILATVKYTYTSPIGHLIFGTLPMGDTFYARPRQSVTVAYTG